MVASKLQYELYQEVFNFCFHNFAESTKSTYRTHRDCYLRFCNFMGLTAIPASSNTVCLYAAFLARSLKFNSIKSYLNTIGVLHKEFGLHDPISDNWHIKSLLTGIKRVKGSTIKQKLPVTVDILKKINGLLNCNISFDASFWAVCLVAFFGLFRKSHPLPTSAAKFNPDSQFTEISFHFCSWGELLVVKWSKTMQFRDRVVSIPLPYITGSPLCPVTAICRALSFTRSAPKCFHAFAYYDPSLPGVSVLTYRAFLFKLRDCLDRLGYDSSDFVGHYFCRDGASLAFQSGVPVEFIKMLGDWKSDSVLLYLTVPLQYRLMSLTMIVKSLTH